MGWIQSLLAKYLGKSFITRASTSIVVFLTSQIAKYLPGVSPDAVAKFGEGLVEIIGALLGLLLALLLDAKMSKPETPKVVK
jgi:hypothetical protein